MLIETESTDNILKFMNEISSTCQKRTPQRNRNDSLKKTEKQSERQFLFIKEDKEKAIIVNERERDR